VKEIIQSLELAHCPQYKQLVALKDNAQKKVHAIQHELSLNSKPALNANWSSLNNSIEKQVSKRQYSAIDGSNSSEHVKKLKLLDSSSEGIYYLVV